MLENNFLSIKIIPQISHPEEEKGKKCPIIWVMSTWKIVSWKTEDFRERVKKPKVYPTDQKASLVTFQKRQQEMKESYLSEMQRPWKMSWWFWRKVQFQGGVLYLIKAVIIPSTSWAWLKRDLPSWAAVLCPDNRPVQLNKLMRERTTAFLYLETETEFTQC